MLFGEDRGEHREYFFKAWQKFKANEPLSALEQQIVTIIKEHPEYQFIFENQEKHQDKDYFAQLGETNPFLHLALHQAVREQLSVNLPKDILKLYKQLTDRFGSAHEAEHCIMNSMAQELWKMQQTQKPFDNKAYLKRLKKNLRDGFWD